MGKIRSLFIGVSLFFASQAFALEHVLITAFEPFGGGKVNQSLVIAQALAHAKSALGPNIQLHLCILPVLYDKAADRAMNCFEAMGREKPRLVVSLGEAECSFKLNTQAFNEDDYDGSDNDGVVRRGMLIDSSGPEQVALRLPVQRMIQALNSSERGEVSVSNDIGRFVCNNTAYHLANYFRLRHAQYGFIHVPASDCAGSVRPKAQAKIVAKMIRAALY